MHEDHAFKYQTLGTPGELPPADGRADGARPVRGYIIHGTGAWDRNDARAPRWLRKVLHALFGGWRA